MTDRSLGETPQESSQTSSDAEPSKAQSADIGAQARDLLEFEFVEVLAVPRRSRSYLACS
jgi:hypothetical protein